jgi:single-stranded-DNA-specific exonuclease
VLEPRYRWVFPHPPAIPPETAALAARLGVGDRALSLLVQRGVGGVVDLERFFAPPAAGLHDPALLPDAERAVDRIRRARERGEAVMVFGDFDADGLTGLAILVRAFRRLGIPTVPYVPRRLEEGHGLSLAAVEAARQAGCRLIVTVDCGTSSWNEVAAAGAAGIDVVITDHHRVPDRLPPAIAVVNPHREDSRYPDTRLTGSGVAYKLASLLVPQADPWEWADLATVGTVADVAPVLGENRSIVRLGLEGLALGRNPGLAALAERAGLPPGASSLDAVAFALAPRLNAAGRVGEAEDAAALLLTDDPQEARRLAELLELANGLRRDVTRQVLDEVTARAASDPELLAGPAVLVHGPWPVGIVGLVAARLAEETGRPAVVGAELGTVIRASCRSDGRLDLVAALAACRDLFVRYGGHRGAAGFELPTERWPAFVARFLALARETAPPDPRPSLAVDLALPAAAVDYRLWQELRVLDPTGPGNPDPLIAVAGLTVTRTRTAAGGHLQLTLRRQRDVLDAILFGGEPLAGAVAEGDQVDVVARLASRVFGGFESLQLEVRDLAPAGYHPELARLSPAAAGGGWG